jgi:hypothetical protein
VVEIFLLVKGEIDLDRIDCRNRCQDAAAKVDQVADLGLGDARNAINR